MATKAKKFVKSLRETNLTDSEISERFLEEIRRVGSSIYKDNFRVSDIKRRAEIISKQLQEHITGLANYFKDSEWYNSGGRELLQSKMAWAGYRALHFNPEQ